MHPRYYNSKPYCPKDGSPLCREGDILRCPVKKCGEVYEVPHEVLMREVGAPELPWNEQE